MNLLSKFFPIRIPQRICSECHYWGGNQGKGFRCLRYPPVAVWYQHSPGRGMQTEIQDIRPRVGPGDTCGEWSFNEI